MELGVTKVLHRQDGNCPSLNESLLSDYHDKTMRCIPRAGKNAASLQIVKFGIRQDKIRILVSKHKIPIAFAAWEAGSLPEHRR
jgi:hypothetical protein